MAKTLPLLQSKLPNVGTTIFTEMSALANAHDAVNLSQGFPDFEPAQELLDRVHYHLTHKGNQYAPMSGTPVLRTRIADYTARHYGREYDPVTEITVTSGATEALFCAIQAVINEGDEVILFEPAYDSYEPVIRLCGGIPVYIKLKYPDYQINWTEVGKVINSNTRMIILNSPHNPTGSVLGPEDLDELTRIIRGNDIFLLSDEVYEHIIFDGVQHQSLALREELSDRSFIVSSFGKSFHCTGWKVGYCVGPAPLMKEFRKVHQFVTFSTSNPFQLALADFIGDGTWFEHLSDFYQKKRDAFLKMIEGSRFEPLKSRGTYFQLLSYKEITNEQDTAFARRLTIDHGIASIPISVFYHDQEDNQVLRFCFAKSEEVLKAGADILKTI